VHSRFFPETERVLKKIINNIFFLVYSPEFSGCHFSLLIVILGKIILLCVILLGIILLIGILQSIILLGIIQLSVIFQIAI
jgi:hypothetical protein